MRRWHREAPGEDLRRVRVRDVEAALRVMCGLARHEARRLIAARAGDMSGEPCITADSVMFRLLESE